MSRVLAFLLLLPAFARPRDIVVTHVRLFDGDRVHEMVRGERVEAVRTTDAGVAARPGARVIDGNGQTLLPGLIDSHMHIQSRDDLVASLALGLTIDLSLHGQPSSDRAIRGGLSEAGARDRADLYNAGFAATVPGGHGTEYPMLYVHNIRTAHGESPKSPWNVGQSAGNSVGVELYYVALRFRHAPSVDLRDLMTAPANQLEASRSAIASVMQI